MQRSEIFLVRSFEPCNCLWICCLRSDVRPVVQEATEVSSAKVMIFPCKQDEMVPQFVYCLAHHRDMPFGSTGNEEKLLHFHKGVLVALGVHRAGTLGYSRLQVRS